MVKNSTFSQVYVLACQKVLKILRILYMCFCVQESEGQQNGTHKAQKYERNLDES